MHRSAKQKVTLLILAGGEGKRLTPQKGFLKVGGVPIVQRILERIGAQFEEIIVVTNSPADYASMRVRYNNFDIRCVKDELPGLGPLGGIYTGLLHSRAPYCFAVACDMPFVSPKLAEYIIEERNSYSAVVPKVKERLEPLFALYSKKLAKRAGKLLGEGRLKISELFLGLKIKTISELAVRRFDPGLLTFFNVNTPKEYRSAKRKAQSEKLSNCSAFAENASSSLRTPHPACWVWGEAISKP